MITPKNIVKHELIGLHVKVMEADNKSQKNIQGRVIDETKKTFKIETSKGEKTIPKQGTKFIFTLPSGTKVKVNGDIIKLKPENRIRKRFKKW